MPNFTRFNIRFEDHSATAVRDIPPDVPPAHVFDALDLAAFNGVVVLEVSADSMPGDVFEATRTLFTQGLAPFAERRQLLVVDGGTHAGGYLAMGDARRLAGGSFPLLGICPEHKVSYPGGPEPDDSRWPLNGAHTHFALVDGRNFGNESELLVSTIRGSRKRGVAIVVNCRPESSIVQHEIPLHARQGNAIIAVRGSGGAADALLDTTSAFFQLMPAGSRIDAVDLHDPVGLINAIRRVVG